MRKAWNEGRLAYTPLGPYVAKRYESGESYGVIAQEVEKIAPELVYTDEKGIKSVAYIDLIIAKIAALEKENIELLKRIEKLEKAK